MLIRMFKSLKNIKFIISTIFMCFLCFDLHLAKSNNFELDLNLENIKDEKIKTSLTKWLRKAKNGDTNAQTKIGIMYEFGRGLEKNYLKAIEWYELAAKNGNSRAQMYLGFIYFEDQSYKYNLKESIKWFKLAAFQGEVKAQTYLGFIYDNGLGVPIDKIKANIWLQIASKTGEKSAIEFLEINQISMTDQEKDKAQNYLESCLKSSFDKCYLN